MIIDENTHKLISEQVLNLIRDHGGDIDKAYIECDDPALEIAFKAKIGKGQKRMVEIATDERNLLYERRRNEIVEMAEQYADRTVGKKPASKKERGQWSEQWDRCFHRKVEALMKKHGRALVALDEAAHTLKRDGYVDTRRLARGPATMIRERVKKVLESELERKQKALSKAMQK